MNRHTRKGLDDASGLDVWDAEGGGVIATDFVPGENAGRLRRAKKSLLRRLGAAVMAEWDGMAMPLKRALYERAVDDQGGAGDAVLKRQLAQLLHDRGTGRHAG